MKIVKEATLNFSNGKYISMDACYIIIGVYRQLSLQQALHRNIYL